VDVILEEELQRQPSQHQRLRQRRGENAEDDDKPQRKQIALVDFCSRAGGFVRWAYMKSHRIPVLRLSLVLR
jgi:hypothetical protein